MMVTMVSYTGLTVVNAIYVGQLGTSELAAIGLSTSLVYFVTAAGMGLLGSVRVHVSNRTGAADPDAASAFAWQAIWLAMALGCCCVLLAPIGAPMFRWMGASAAVVPLAASYYGWRTVAAPVLFVSTALTGAFQGRGDTRTPMVANLLANLVNLVLDPFLIFGWGPFPALGIDGAAIGAGVGVSAGLALLAWRARGTFGPRVGPDRARLAAIWRVGAPMALQYQLDVGSFLVFAALLAGAGDAHLAAHVIIVRMAMVSFLPCMAIGEATSVLVGQSLGAGAPERARQALRLASVQASAWMLALAVVFVAAPRLFAQLFGATPEVVNIAVPVMVMYALVQVLDGQTAVVYGALSGAGDTRFVMHATVLSAWLIKLPVAAFLVLGLGLGVLGNWLGIASEIVVMLAFGYARTRGVAWLRAPVAELAPELGR